MHALSFVIRNTEPSLFLVQNGGDGTGKRSETINEVSKDNINFQESMFFFQRGYIITIREEGFRGCPWMRWEGGAERPPSLKFVTHILKW